VQIRLYIESDLHRRSTKLIWGVPLSYRPLKYSTPLERRVSEDVAGTIYDFWDVDIVPGNERTWFFTSVKKMS